MKERISKIIVLFVAILLYRCNLFADTFINVTKYVDNAKEVYNTFSYDVVPSSNNPSEVSGVVSNFDLVFDENSNKSERQISMNYTIDFSEAVFSKVGTYEFTIEEVSSSNQIEYPRDTNTYTILVNVTHEVDEENTPTGNYVIDVLPTAVHNETGSKSEIIFNTNPLSYVKLSKKVSGDMADRDKYFKFKVELSNEGVFKIEGQDEIVEYNGEIINTTNEYDSTKDNYVYLKHGQSITIGYDSDSNIRQLESGNHYTVTEEDASEYKTYVNGGINDTKTGVLLTYNDENDNELSFVNNYESTALTGVFNNILPFVILFLVSLIGFVLIKKREN